MAEENIGSIRPDFSLNGKLAIITGASAGIGKEIALAFAAAGAEIIVTARTESKLIELKNEVEKDGGKCDYLVNDITDIGQIQQLADFIRKKLSKEDMSSNDFPTNSLEIVSFIFPTAFKTPLPLYLDLSLSLSSKAS